MDFLKEVKGHISHSDHKEAAILWWGALSKSAVRNNVEADQLLQACCTNWQDNLRRFCKGLYELALFKGYDYLKNKPEEAGKTVIERTMALVIKGPPAKSRKGVWVHFLPLDRFRRRHLEIPGDNNKIVEIWWDTKASKEWKMYVKPEAKVQGYLPVAFWTSRDDISKKLGTNPSAKNVASLLGLELKSTLLELIAEKRALDNSCVPTGWDGYKSEHFLVANPNPSIPETGYTKDLRHGTSSCVKGAREVVTKSISTLTMTFPGAKLL